MWQKVQSYQVQQLLDNSFKFNLNPFIPPPQTTRDRWNIFNFVVSRLFFCVFQFQEGGGLHTVLHRRLFYKLGDELVLFHRIKEKLLHKYAIFLSTIFIIYHWSDRQTLKIFFNLEIIYLNFSIIERDCDCNFKWPPFKSGACPIHNSTFIW